MLVEQYISTSSPTLQNSATLQEAMKILEDYDLSHIPVLEGNILLACMPSYCTEEYADSNIPIDSLRSEMEFFSLNQEDNILDALSILSQFESNMVPIVDHDNHYVGILTGENLLYNMGHTPFCQEPGTTLVVSTNHRDYSLSTITQIVESNNARLLGAFVSAVRENQIFVTLKISSREIIPILNDLKRFNINVEAGLHEEPYEDELKARYNSLMNYLKL